MINDNVGDISITQVNQWLTEAQQTLEQAQKLCSNAQSSLDKTFHKLTTQLPDELHIAEMFFVSYQNQLDVVSQQVDRVKTIYKTKVGKITNDFEKLLDPNLKALEKIMQQLKSTEVPSDILIEDEGNDKNLLDFIATESTDLIKINIEIYRSNYTKLQKLLETQLQGNIIETLNQFRKQHQVITKEFDQLNTVQVELTTSHGKILESNQIIGTILRENQSLENELVSLLEMLTNHYDQCSKAVKLMYSKNETLNVNLHVLETDAFELDDVFKELSSVYDIIITNESKSSKLFDQNLNVIKRSLELMKQELEKFRTFKTKAIPEYLRLLDICLEILNKCSISDAELADLSPCEIYAETVKQILFHYTQFLDIYKTKYLTELHHEQYLYPKKYLKKINNFLNEELYRLQLEELNHRKSWVTKYGEFIPKEFKLPGEQEIPFVVQVVTQGLEHVQPDANGAGEFNEGEEKNLLDLMKRIRIQK
ncbi:ATG17 [Candida pseudojiufengensis]|uniref:ATG17 n=1 Tax=Candida pseudojiufengensis TaxID=497109 RepID=UPI002225B095|nr:ATG17 [Candida pseudojiufengensis]KAI5966480.1 ATG17 [Candida pseudojiufengensis]